MNATDKTYNGYANYETWAVALWIDNDEGAQGYWQERAREAYRDAQGTMISTRRRAAIGALSAMIRSDHEEGMPELTGIYVDLLNAALSEVDWRDVASNILDDDMMNEIDAEETADDDDES